jgi:hypothetical protein
MTTPAKHDDITTPVAIVDVRAELGFAQLLDIEHGDIGHCGWSTNDQDARMKHCRLISKLDAVEGCL